MTWQVCVEAASRICVAPGYNDNLTFNPGDEFGPDFPIYTLDDSQQSPFWALFPSAYLARDNQTIVDSSPP